MHIKDVWIEQEKYIVLCEYTASLYVSETTDKKLIEVTTNGS